MFLRLSPIIIPDDVDLIQKTINEVIGVDWIITTGGTGFGVRDNTPEVSRTDLVFSISLIDFWL